MKRFCCLAMFLLSAVVPAAWAQLPATYMISNEPPYRNQGSYGTCWAFATMASIETNIIKEGLPSYDANAGLSERDLAWHSGFLDQIGGGLTGINNGGDYLMSAAYLARGAGPLTEAQAPYSGMATAPPTGQVAPYYVRDIEWYHNVADIKQAVATYGAVSTCWQTSSNTQQRAWSSVLNNYVYYDPGHGVPNPGPGYLNQPNHAVAIVGWNDNVQTPGGTGCWIIRNSWGSNTQHIGVSYNDYFTGHDAPDVDAACLGAVSFHNVVANAYQTVYYHNDFGWTDQQPHAYAFNHYVASQNGFLKSVSFYTTDDNVGYTAKIYKQFQNGVLGQLVATVSGTQTFEGFHTVDLFGLVPLAQGQDYYVELQTSNGQQANDGNVLKQRILDFQNVTGYAYTTALPGESFFSDNGMGWTDLQTVDASANFAINALTVAAPDFAWKGGGGAGPTRWEVAANWNPNTAVPSGPGLTISFGNQPAANNVVEISSGGKSVGNLILFGTTSTTIQSSGGFGLTLDNNGHLSTIDATGNHTIATSVILNNDAQVIGSGTVTLSGGINGSHDLSVLGNVVTSSLQVPTLGIESGATFTMVNNGDSSYAGIIRGGGTLAKLGTGKLTLTGANVFAGLTIVSGGTLQLAPIAQNCVLNRGGADIQAGQIVFDYTGGSDSAATIRSLLTASCDGGRWDLGQFRNSTAASTGLTLGSRDEPMTQKVTVMATYPGDFNLDGLVDSLDQAIWFANAFTGAMWQQGDANYDGAVNGLDRDLWFSHVGLPPITVPSSGAPSVMPAPEPGTLALSAASLVVLVAYSWQRRKRGA
jgi:autotransporter-associated beta strand protein